MRQMDRQTMQQHRAPFYFERNPKIAIFQTLRIETLSCQRPLNISAPPIYFDFVFLSVPMFVTLANTSWVCLPLLFPLTLMYIFTKSAGHWPPLYVVRWTDFNLSHPIWSSPFQSGFHSLSIGWFTIERRTTLAIIFI